MDNNVLIYGVIVVFSFVQSVFGMGLLVFGTPTLLLMGIPYSEALGWLLPASIAISAIQLSADPRRALDVWRGYGPLLCLLPLTGALALVLIFDIHTKIDMVIGVTMIAAAVVRLNAKLQIYISRIILYSRNSYLIMMGGVHGFTNMGGAMLSIYATSNNEKKIDIRSTISSYYLLFGVSQLTILCIFNNKVIDNKCIFSALISSAIYVVIGRYLFEIASSRIYNSAITAFIASYGVAVLLKSGL